MYSPETVSMYYDKLGHGEWDRLDASAHARLIFHLHAHFLQGHIGAGRSVLDAVYGGRGERFALTSDELDTFTIPKRGHRPTEIERPPRAASPSLGGHLAPCFAASARVLCTRVYGEWTS